jgi:hypothetical protein
LSKIKIIRENCDLSLSQNNGLPNNAYLVTYIVNDNVNYDLVQSIKVVDIFDHYYDRYKEDLKDIKQSAGTVNPKLWNGKLDD